MQLAEFIEKMELTVVCGSVGNLEVSGVYICDLLSHCMGKIEENNIWITVQNNINVAAVCHLAEASAVLLPENILPDDDLSKKACDEDILILKSSLSAFELSKKAGQLL